MAGRVVSIALIATDRMGRAFRSAGSASDGLADRLDRASKAGKEFGDVAGGVVRAGSMIGKISAAGPLAAGLAALAPAAGAAALGMGALAAVAVPSLNRVKEAIAAQEAAQKNAGAAAAQAQSRALALAGAQQALKSAIRDAADAHQQAVQRVRDAADAHQQAVRRVGDAERNYSDAVKDSEQATEDLNDARKEAAQDAKDLAQRIADAQFDLRDSALSAEEAEADYQKTLADPEATELQKKRASLAVEQAKRRHEQQQALVAKLREDQKRADADGVEGSEKVKTARDALAEANRRVADTEADIAEARANVTKSEAALAEARANVAKTDAKSAESIANARRAVAAVNISAASSTDAYADALAKLSPHERKLMGDMKGLSSAFEKWQLAMQPHVLPLLSQGIGILKSQIPSLTPVVEGAAGAVGGLLDRIAKGTKSAEFAQFKKNMTDLVPTALTGFGNVAINVAKGVAGIINAFMPHAPAMLGAVESLTAKFATWGTSLDGSGGFKAFMDWARGFADLLIKNGPQIQQVLTAVANALIHVGTSLTPVAGALGMGAVSMLGLLAKAVNSMSPGQIQALAYAFVFYRTAIVAATLASKAFTAAMVASQFVKGFLDVSTGAAAGASAATRYGAALRMNAAMAWTMVKAQTASALAYVRSTAATVASTVAQKAAAVATRVWAAATAFLNAVMAGNVFAIVVLAIIALIAAVVLAYRHSETFRTIVQACWRGIQEAAQIAWGFLKGIFEALGKFITGTVVPAFQQAWAIAKVVFAGVWEAVRSAWSFIQPVFAVIANVLRTVLGVAFTVFENVVKVVWIAIQLYVRTYWAIIKLIFDAIVAFVRNVLGPIFTWLYNNIIKPVWDGIRLAINLAWTAIRIIFSSVKLFVEQTLAPVFTWLWRNVMVPIWDGIKTTISTVWNSGIKPVFEALKTAVGAVRNAFSTAVDGIKTIWDRLQDIAKKPVNFVIGLYNKGIVNLVNKIASFAGIGTQLKEIPTFARGGVMPGYAPGRDSLLAAVSPGESIFRPEFTKAVGSKWVTDANAIARSQGPGGVARWMSGGSRLGGEGMAFARGGVAPGFAGAFGLGGIVDDFVGGVKNFTFGNVQKAAEAMLGKLLGAVPGSGVFRDVINAVPAWIKDSVLGWLKDKIGAGGKGMQAGLAFARAQAGKPYLWGGVGPTGFDCSGFMGSILNVIQGRSPFSRMFTTHSFNGLTGPGGFVRDLQSGFMVGVTDAGVGHMAGQLLGVNVESSGSGGVQVGAGARGAYDGLFPYQYGLTADSGALNLQPGWNPPTFNGTGRPELLSTPHPGGQPIVIQVQPSGSGLDDLFFTWLRNGVRSRGGNVQVVLGRG